jgi:small subunit ribosomal protein S4
MAARWMFPSFAVKANDVIEVRANAVSRQLANKGLELSTSRPVPGWIVLNKDGLKGTVVRMPSREDIQPIANEQAVVEFYSR